MEYSFFDIALFCVVMVLALLLDLKAHSQDKPVNLKSAAIWSVLWTVLALAFAAYVFVEHSAQDGQLFLAGYFLERALSMDNLFVIMAIFAAFSVEDKFQHRVLYYGILGALVLRFVFIFAGTAIIALLGKPALVAFGLFVLYTAWAMWKNMHSDHEEIEDYSQHWSVRFVKRFYPVYPKIESHNFFVRNPDAADAKVLFAKWAATPLFLCLICIEFADIMFAFDSVPAIIAITEKPFLVYTSNIFAILGMRSLYFLLAGAKQYLKYLEHAVIVILVFIGFKLLLGIVGYHVPPMISLAVVTVCLLIGIGYSLIMVKKEKK